MLKKAKQAFLLFLLVFMGSCHDSEENVPKFEIDFKWNPPCSSLYASPEITIAHVPEGTVQFYVELNDLDLKTYNHGAGYTKYEGSNIIPAGSAKGTYLGPSPPHGIIHTYEIIVKALGPNNTVLGIGRMQHRYPPEGEEEIRWSPCGGKNVK
jgi:phosphatidylethanolamine-binding protein (PEBP) family uncharacterized protein